MKQHGRLLRLVPVVVMFSLVLVACDSDDADTTQAEPTTTEAAPPPETTVATGGGEATDATPEIPFLVDWEASGHNAAEDEAFRHWDEDDPPVIPTECAKCHSETGHLDFLGVDGSAAGSVEADAPIGTTVTCVTCHNDVTLSLDSVEMPSGAVLTDLGSEARCMNCHQGRHSTVSVNASIEEAGADEDEVSEDLGFLNIHYYAAAASKYGTLAQGGYEYEGNDYDAFFAHVDGYETCQECHDTHTLELKIEECSTCHTGVSTVEDLRDVRMPGSLVDYDGDGDLDEGVFFELEGLRERLYEALQMYASEVAGAPLVYSSGAYPYFFLDTNDDGVTDDDEAVFPNQFNMWTPRLVKAAYNYQVSLKDPGNFAHGGKYHMQLIYDSIVSLNEALSTPVSLEGLNRIDHGHFAGSEEAFRHWDEDEPAVVPASCAKCHSAEGLPTFLTEGVNVSQEPANGFQCATCHNDLDTYTRYEVTEVDFPSGATIDSGDANTNLCINCHQGRSSTGTVDAAIGDAGDNEVVEDLSFINIHYFAAGATLFGTEVQGGYEYPGNTYAGRFAHVEPYSNCTQCHDTHTQQVEYEECSACHEMVGTLEDLQLIRISTDDFDGDGDTDEGIAGEIATMQEALLEAIQAYATATDGVEAIVYDPHAYPYFFTDLNADGVPTPDEASFDNRFATWTPNLLRAAYIYQYAEKDPGGFAHNGSYIMQMLYDAHEAIGGDTSTWTRP
jgi:hypothetical protein